MSGPADRTDEALGRINRIPGVLGSMLVAAEDGLVVSSDLMIGVPGPPVAALAASLYQRALRSLRTAHLGAVGFMHIEADGGYLFVAGDREAPEVVLVVIAERNVNVAMVRLESARAIRGEES